VAPPGLRRDARRTPLSGDATSFAEFEGASAGLLGQDDLEEAAAALQPGTSAAVLVWENRWAAPIAIGLRRSGGQLVASGRIPVQAILASLDAVEANHLIDAKEGTVPGLLRGIARTAVVAGTATAVSNRVSRRQADRWSRQGLLRRAGACATAPAGARGCAGPGSDRAAQAARCPQGPAHPHHQELAAQKAKILGT
jgi:hypothetical protein